MTQHLRRPESTVGQILTVHPATRKVEVGLRDGSTLQVAVIETGSFFRWPDQGENWRICRRGHTWYLDSQVEQKAYDENTMGIEDLDPGHAKVYSEVIKTPSGRQVAMTDDIPSLDDLATIASVSYPWQDYTPVWTNLSVSDGSQSGRYVRIGEVVFWLVHLVLGTEDTPISASPVSVSLPIKQLSDPSLSESVTSISNVFNGTAKYAVSGTVYVGHCNTVSGTTARLTVLQTDDVYAKQHNLDTTVPDAWAEGDEIHLSGWYRANL